MKIPSIIHPKAYIAEDAKISSGCIVFPNAKIGPSSKIRSSVWVDYNVVVGHDVQIGKYSFNNAPFFSSRKCR